MFDPNQRQKFVACQSRRAAAGLAGLAGAVKRWNVAASKAGYGHLRVTGPKLVKAKAGQS